MKCWGRFWIQTGLGQKKNCWWSVGASHFLFYWTCIKEPFSLRKELLQRRFLRFKYNRWYFRSSVSCICVRTPNLGSLHSYNLWQFAAFCSKERLAPPLPHPSVEASAGNFTWPRSPSFPMEDGSVWLLFDSRYKLAWVSNLFHPVNGTSCWQLCACRRWPWYYMGYHFQVCEKLYFAVLACSLLVLCFSRASIVVSEACVWKQSNRRIHCF